METTITRQNRELSTRVLKNKKQIIMKKFYLLAAAATILTACTNNEKMTADLSYDGPVMIGFETYHEKSTKAAVNNQSDMTSINGGFGVYGYKHLNDREAAAGIINLSDINPESSVNYVTPIFDNVKVWYVNGATTKDFTYAVPKYWDKEKFYTFFAYAPYADKKAAATDAVEDNPDTDEDESKPATDEVKGISFDQSTGKFTRNDIKALQSTNITTSVTVGEESRTQYTTADETSVTDYLIAPYVPHQKSGTTNQTTTGGYTGTAYDGQEITVGFTFSHILSKLNVFVKAKNEDNDPEDDDKNGHKYSGVQDIKVTKLNIENLPNATTEIATYAQKKTDEVAGTWSPYRYTTTLNIISGTNATSAKELYILDGGKGNATEVTNAPTRYIPQEFHYFIAPNDPDDPTTTDNPETTEIVENKEHYTLNIDYVITYVDETKEPYSRTIDLSKESAAFESMAQNNTYNINITIGLTQIYFTVEAINGWATATETNIEIE